MPLLFRRPLMLAALALCAGLPAAAATPTGGYSVVRSYPHDPGAFTEGLFYLNGELFESTGMPGQSNVRRVRLQDGVVLQSKAISPNLFGEGIVNWGDEIVSLTWQDHIGYRWDRKTLTQKKTFHYPGEGWALTQDGKHLIMSDGTPELRILDPLSFREIKRVKVTADGHSIANLNELEFVKGEVLANIWQTNMIARIDPATGKVKAWIDLSGLPETTHSPNPDAVLNGIGYDRQHDRLFVTGKNWPHLYEIKLTPPRPIPKAGR